MARPARVVADIALFRVSNALTRACRYSAARAEWRALCPTLLPRAFVGQPPYPSPGVQVFDKPPAIDIGYGAPVGSGVASREWRDNFWRHHPCCFLHFDIRKESVYGEPRWHPKAGYGTTLGGRRGWLRPAESSTYDRSAYFSNHFRFFFHEAEEHYVVTLHDFGPHTVQLLDALVGALEPVEPLPTPLPDRPPSPCKTYWQTTICRRGPVAAITALDGAVWATKPEANRVVRIDTSTGREPAMAVRVRFPTQIVARGDHLWVLSWGRRKAVLHQLDASSGRIRKSVPVGRIAPAGMEVAYGAIWVSDSWRRRVTRVDPAAGPVATIGTGRGASGMDAGFGAMWVANTGDGTVTRVDVSTDGPGTTIAVGSHPQAVAVGEGAVWVANTGDGTVARIDPASNRVVATIRVGLFPIGLSISGDCVWVAVYGEDLLRCIQPSTNEVSASSHRAGAGPFSVTAGFGEVWVANQRGVSRAH